MAEAAIIASDGLWQAIRAEAQRAAAADPVFGEALAGSILAHDDLAAALAGLIGQRLGGGATERARFTSFCRDAFHREPGLIEAAGRDLRVIALCDPAITELLPPLLHYKGYVALQAWRVSNWLWQRGRNDFALMMQSASSERLQVSIHPSASIGASVFLDHATGIIVGADSSISDDVTMMQNVTIGRGPDRPLRAPRIGRGAYLSSGSSIIGDISIGDFAKIGAGAVVTHDVPAGCTAVGVPARLTNCPEEVLPV